MIGFFRRIRKKLADDNQLLKYSSYAVGEIVLVVIGILIALSINNWNENRKQEEGFKLYIEQAFNSISADLAMLQEMKEIFVSERVMIDSLINKPETFRKEQIPTLLFLLSWGNIGERDFKIALLPTEIDINNNSRVQKSLHSRIIELKHMLTNASLRGFDDLRLGNYLLDNHDILPPPSSHMTYNYDQIPNSFYSQYEINRVYELVLTKKVIKELKYADLGKEQIINSVNAWIDYGSDLIEVLKEHHSLFNDVGIVGTSFESDWELSVPLQVDTKDDYIWSSTLYLKEGEVKFRTNNNWVQNWGGTTFPEGKAIWHSGPNIKVDKAGTYKIILDLDENTYLFELIDD